LQFGQWTFAFLQIPLNIVILLRRAIPQLFPRIILDSRDSETNVEIWSVVQVLAGREIEPLVSRREGG
jgi:hypothetical protein